MPDSASRNFRTRARLLSGSFGSITQMSDNSAEMTDEMAVQHWFRIAQDTENLVNQGAVPVQPHSELAEDDALSSGRVR
jgi:hypothetical protein